MECASTVARGREKRGSSGKVGQGKEQERAAVRLEVKEDLAISGLPHDA